ncbi:uncharacterized protein LOC107019292 [Solanum pennellii]|uniref:Uncharacterized protein LOC107019292 n=1 Tax=Solanum pennellii TaxID=28526 RepID=A0ABM1GSM5_SOLPN|nr:uncharacterized protein LOC107019292 [Solanum pennellii]
MNENGGSVAARVYDFVRINAPEFLGSHTSEDPQNFFDGIMKIFEVMQVTGNDRVELASYRLKDVSHIWLMTHAQQVEGDKIMEHAKENKKSRQKVSSPAPSSTSVPSSENRFDQKVTTAGSKSQGSVSGTKTYPTFPKCSKNHTGECLAGKEGCFGCGHHKLRDCPSRKGQGGGNGIDQSTTSSAPDSLPTQQGDSSSTGGNQRQNRLC